MATIRREYPDVNNEIIARQVPRATIAGSAPQAAGYRVGMMVTIKPRQTKPPAVTEDRRHPVHAARKATRKLISDHTLGRTPDAI